MTLYVTEVLKEINDDVSLLTTKYKRVGKGGPLGIIFAHAYVPHMKFLLPEGVPPFKPSPQPLGMTPSHMLQEVKRFYVLMRTDVSAITREKVFIQMLESIHPEEAQILLAIKDQDLPSLYPNLTKSVIAEANYAPPMTEEEKVAEQATRTKKGQSGPGRPKKTEAEKQITKEARLDRRRDRDRARRAAQKAQKNSQDTATESSGVAVDNLSEPTAE